MVDIKRLEEEQLRKLFGVIRGRGYVFDFSDASFSIFFMDEFGIDIDEPKHATQGGSKANRLMMFLRAASAPVASKVLRRLWEHFEEAGLYDGDRDRQAKDRYFRLVERLESGGHVSRTDAIERFVADETLDQLVGSIERDILADKPQLALDRLHTYCMKKVAHLLAARGLECGDNEPLHGRIGKYVKTLSQEHQLQDATLLALKGTIGFFEKLNHVRNNRSLAHDNSLLGHGEAKYLFECTSAMLRLFKAIDTKAFGS